MALICHIIGSCVVSFVMTTRRDALAAALALLTEASVSAQNPTGSNTGPVFVHDLPNLTMDDWQVTVSHVPYAPGQVGQTHHHAGFVLAYVLEGAFVTRISGQAERVYKTGEMFYEGIGATHEVSKIASSTEPAKLLTLIFAKKGETLTTPPTRSQGTLRRTSDIASYEGSGAEENELIARRNANTLISQEQRRKRPINCYYRKRHYASIAACHTR